MTQNIYELKLHESTFFQTEVHGTYQSIVFEYIVTRVPKGWLYVLHTDREVNFFVPYDEEFKTNNTEDLGGVTYME